MRFNIEELDTTTLVNHSGQMISILVQIQNARYDKKYYGEGLSIQEAAEFLAINKILEQII